jgi:hypothetical protein
MIQVLLYVYRKKLTFTVKAFLCWKIRGSQCCSKYLLTCIGPNSTIIRLETKYEVPKNFYSTKVISVRQLETRFSFCPTKSILPVLLEEPKRTNYCSLVPHLNTVLRGTLYFLFREGIIWAKWRFAHVL